MPDRPPIRIRPEIHQRDANGNLLRDFGQIYVYDAFDRIVEVRDAMDNPKVSYKYVPGSHLIAFRLEVRNGQHHKIERFLYSGGKLVAVYDITNVQDPRTEIGVLKEKYIYSPDGKILLKCKINNKDYTVYYGKWGHEGKVAGLKDATGKIVQSYAYSINHCFTLMDGGRSQVHHNQVKDKLLSRIIFNNNYYDPVADLLQLEKYRISLRFETRNKFYLKALPKVPTKTAATPRPKYITHLEQFRQYVKEQNIARLNEPNTTWERAGRVLKTGAIVVLNVGAWCLGPEVGVPVTGFTLGMGGATAIYNRKADLETFAQGEVPISWDEGLAIAFWDTMGPTAAVSIGKGEDPLMKTKVQGVDRAELLAHLGVGILGAKYTPRIGTATAQKLVMARQFRADRGITPNFWLRNSAMLSDKWLLNMNKHNIRTNAPKFHKYFGPTRLKTLRLKAGRRDLNIHPDDAMMLRMLRDTRNTLFEHRDVNPLSHSQLERHLTHTVGVARARFQGGRWFTRRAASSMQETKAPASWDPYIRPDPEILPFGNGGAGWQHVEWRILYRLLLETSKNTVGEIWLITDRVTCGSCSAAVDYFRQHRPGIKLDVKHAKVDRGKAGAKNPWNKEYWTEYKATFPD